MMMNRFIILGRIFVLFGLLGLCAVSYAKRSAERLVVKSGLVRQTGVSNHRIVVKDNAALLLSGDAESVLPMSTVSLSGEDAWLLLPNVSMREWRDSGLQERILIDGQPMVEGGNSMVRSYYNGVYVRPVPSARYAAAELHVNGKRYPVVADSVWTGERIPGGDNAFDRFVLRRGYMMVVAENEDGTGAGKVYVAAEKELEAELDASLKKRVSFVRVLPWNYATKRGIGGNFARKEELGLSWFYTWGVSDLESTSIDYVPMCWSGCDEALVQRIVDKPFITHVLAFNEPDGKDQANLSPQQAVERYARILKTGLRVGSPACTEGRWKTWLDEFMKGCREREYRVDFIAIHWYDWGNWIPTKNPSPTDQQIDQMVARFKKDIDDCYAKYGLPIWITEFNANKNRLTDVQIRFLEKAIPMLEAHPHVERYAYFQPFGGNGNFLENGELTKVARAYGAVPSTAALR